MKKMIIFAGLLCVSLQANSIFAGDLKLFSQRLMIKNRARTRATAHNGRVVYHYEEIRDLQEQTGNVVADSSVKQIYSYTKVTKPRKNTFKDPVEIGNIEAEGKVKQITNIVEVQGDIKSLFHPISIGNITLHETGGTIENIVTIEGSVEAK